VLKRTLIAFLLLSFLLTGISCASQPERTLREMYKEHYLHENGEYFYVQDAGSATEHRINLAGTSEEDLDPNSPYELVFVRVFSEADPDSGETLQWLEYEIRNHRGYAVRLPLQTKVEIQIAGRWYACVSEAAADPLMFFDLPEEPLTRRILLTRCVYGRKQESCALGKAPAGSLQAAAEDGHAIRGDGV